MGERLVSTMSPPLSPALPQLQGILSIGYNYSVGNNLDCAGSREDSALGMGWREWRRRKNWEQRHKVHTNVCYSVRVLARNISNPGTTEHPGHMTEMRH